MFAVSFSNPADRSLQIGADDRVVVAELSQTVFVAVNLPTPLTEAQALAIAILQGNKDAIAKAMDELEAQGFEGDGDVLVTDEWLDTVLDREDGARTWRCKETKERVIRWLGPQFRNMPPEGSYVVVDHLDNKSWVGITRSELRALILIQKRVSSRFDVQNKHSIPRKVH